MRVHAPRLAVVLVLVVAAASVASVAACEKSAEREADEAANAAVMKEMTEQRALDALDGGDPRHAARLLVESQEADERSAREAADVSAAVARERDRYRAVLAKEIGWIDRRMVDMERIALGSDGNERLEKERELARVRHWRERLDHDLDALEHPPPGTDWTALKQQIERDLYEDRPPSIPHSYEKPYGI